MCIRRDVGEAASACTHFGVHLIMIPVGSGVRLLLASQASKCDKPGLRWLNVAV
jgi:hypothetical protein